jgi:integrase
MAEVFMVNKGSKGRGDKHWERYKSFRTAFETACTRANLSDVSPHVLRHTFATRPVTDLRAVPELGGWKKLAMVQRYAHLSQKHTRASGELLANNSPSIFTTPAKVVVEAESSNLKHFTSVGR